MICFKDMSFCGSDCTNSKCRRHFGEGDRLAAKRWWGSDEAPVAFTDFSGTCPDYESAGSGGVSQ